MWLWGVIHGLSVESTKYSSSLSGIAFGVPSSDIVKNEHHTLVTLSAAVSTTVPCGWVIPWSHDHLAHENQSLEVLLGG